MDRGADRDRVLGASGPSRARFSGLPSNRLVADEVQVLEASFSPTAHHRPVLPVQDGRLIGADVRKPRARRVVVGPVPRTDAQDVRALATPVDGVRRTHACGPFSHDAPSHDSQHAERRPDQTSRSSSSRSSEMNTMPVRPLMPRLLRAARAARPPPALPRCAGPPRASPVRAPDPSSPRSAIRSTGRHADARRRRCRYASRSNRHGCTGSRSNPDLADAQAAPVEVAVVAQPRPARRESARSSVVAATPGCPHDAHQRSRQL